MVNDWPEQIVPLATLKVGVIFTVTLLTTGIAVQPCALVPVTVYGVVLNGETVALPPLNV
jgi:hypothetical protein